MWRCVPNKLLVDRRGATAVELALVAAPLFFLIFAILELSIVFVLSLNLSNAAATLGRQLRVGQIIAPGASVTTSSGTQLDVADFKTALCNNMGFVPYATCMIQLQVDVRTLSSFQNQTPPNPISGGAFNTTGLCFYSGAASNIVEFRAYYLWPVITPVILSALANVTSVVTSTGTSTGTWFSISVTEVFKNEPSSSITNTGNSC